ncbi:MAG: 30S ribosomal protein S1 [Mariprofundaceae bacterium]|nr:30S ribosomal protein S1 [Mariprofundaceae bacterium]
MVEEQASDQSAIPEEDNFKAMFEASLKEEHSLKKGESIRGVVVAISDENVIMDIGTKNEGIIPIAEFTSLAVAIPTVGSDIEAIVVSAGGSVRLSVLEEKRSELWAMVDTAITEGKTVRAKIISEVKGGFRVDLGGLQAFMPRSEVDTHAGMGADQLLDNTYDVSVLEATQQPSNIVVSRKQPLAIVAEAKRADFFASVHLGDKITGEVKRLADFGAFVDLGGIDALLHVSDMAWRRINHPSEMLSIGQSITAEVVKLNTETGKISISTKNLQQDPWEHVTATYDMDMRLTGTVRKLLDFGAVVELEAGVEGLIHRSEMSWTRQDVKPTEILAEGDVVDVAVLEVNADQRRIRLSLKEVAENPWQAWMTEHPEGSRVTGKIRNITDFGFFVGLADGLDGLVHIGNLSWTEAGEEVIQSYSKGQDIKCVVLGVDVAKQRIGLGIKQLSDDPFEVFISGVKRGASIKGKVTEIVSGAVWVELAEGVRARLALREVPKDHDTLKEGDEIEAKVIDVNRRRRQVDLSIRQFLNDEEREAVRQYSQSLVSKEEPSALALELQRKLLGKV